VAARPTARSFARCRHAEADLGSIEATVPSEGYSSAVDPLTLVCVAAVLVPARRAARMDPTIALRAD
jgi:ABC-type antimicrobial peptide transport system permease subunit